MGLAHARLGEDAPAEAEFRKDIASEPDLPDNYTQLGLLYSRLGRDEEAENAFREALRRDSRMADAHFGLAKLEFAQKKNAAALKSIDGALSSDPAIPGGHFLKGRILTQLGREPEAQKEFTAAKNQLDSGLQKDRQDLEGNTVPNPELKQQP